ncbi:MAG TPA: FlgO family outer membrane protein [Rheinheimera sp.]|uniref:FlgO family outer membrane protein n=1 Tax=Rheinheimera sp. TaxID=1869214 RepID=UPI002F937086
MKVGICLAAVAVLSGCQLLPEYQNSCMPCAPSAIADGGDASANPISTGGNYLPSVTDYPPRPTKPLSDYAADLAFQLLQSMQYVLPEQPVAISTFVEFDQQLSNTTAVGNQLAEHMYYQMQRLGIPVADIKLSSQIRVTPAGELVFSRDSYLDTKQRVNYVLAGTILRDSAGLVVNARVMHMRTKTVIGSAQLHIPDFVLAAPTGIEHPDIPRVSAIF